MKKRLIQTKFWQQSVRSRFETFTARNLASGGSHPPFDNHGRAESIYKYYFLRTGALLFIMVYYIPSAAAAADTFFRFSD